MSEENTSTNSESSNSGDSANVSAEIQQLKEALSKAQSDFLYLRAEFDTYKRNALKENLDLRKYGPERFVGDLLGVLDNFDRALETSVSPEQLQSFVSGIQMTAAEIKKILVKHGVTEVACMGEPFDPRIHEAVGQEESTHFASGNVLRVLRKPYKIHEKLIRPGQVIVATPPRAPRSEA